MVTSPYNNQTYWRRNIAALEQCEPELPRQLKCLPASERFVEARSADGSPLLGIVMGTGQTAALCHSEKPRLEAEQWIKNLGEGFHKNAHVLLLGFGAGYYPMALFEQSDNDTLIWIVEPDIELFAAALHVMDFTRLLLASRVRFAVGLPEEQVARLLFSGSTCHRMRGQGIQMALSNVAKGLYAGYIQQLSAAINLAIQTESLKFKTSEIQGKTILSNVMQNLRFMLQGAPFNRLHSAAAGVPAFIIAPGPSLQDALPIIAAYRDKALWIAVDTAHPILRQKGISSDLVVSLDFTELNARHFESIENDETILLAFPGIDPSISERYQGRTFFYDHCGTVDFALGATQILRSLDGFGAVGGLVSYGSTAHIAMHAARMMGCSPIILIGNDLAFPDDKWYSDGAMQNKLDQPERETEPLLSVMSNDGGTVQTSGLYNLYLDTFSELIKGCAAPVFNTSPRGANIEGASYMNLNAVLSHYCMHIVDASFLASNLKPDLGYKHLCLCNDLKILSEACRRANRGLNRLIEQLNEISPATATFRRDMIQLMKSFFKLLKEEETSFSLCTTLCSRSTLLVLGQGGPSSLFGGDSTQANQEAYQRCSDFLNDMQKAMKMNGKSFHETLRQLNHR